MAHCAGGDGGRIAIVVHGGAGWIRDEVVDAARAGCRRAADAGWQVLSRGGSALDAVVAAVVVLEDDPFFNAGRGSVLTRAGDVEMDALVVDGGKSVPIRSPKLPPFASKLPPTCCPAQPARVAARWRVCVVPRTPCWRRGR